MPENRHKTGFRGPSPEVGKDTQFKPGQSGNPGGRPRAIISDWLSHELESLDPETQQQVAQRVVALSPIPLTTKVAAKEAVQLRLKEIHCDTDPHAERQQIEDALSSLRTLEREK